MSTASVWITKRNGKRGVRHIVRWIEPGSGKCRSSTFRLLADAREHVGKLRRDIRNGDYHVPVKISFSEWKERHLEDLRNSSDIDLSPKTIAGHQEALNALERACSPATLTEITPSMIREFRKKQLENGYAPRTINKHIEGIRSALSYAVRSEIIPTNKLLGPHRLFLRDEEKPPRILEVGEVTALMNVAKDLRQKAAISLAYYHGMRRGEICFLRWDDIDLEDKRMNIVNRVEKRTKTRVSRSVALRKETAAILTELQKQRVNEWVFERPQTFYWQCDKWFPRLVEIAKLDECSLHDLRKTCNTLMQDAGVSQETAMQVLGHKTAQVNRQHYTGALKEQQRMAVNSLPSVG